MTLILGLGLEAQAAVDDVVVRDLEAVVERLAHGAAGGIAGLRPGGLEQVELAAIVCAADHRAAVRVVDAERAFAVERPEAGVLQLAPGRLHVQRKTTGSHGAKAVAALRSLDHAGGTQFGVVAAAVGFDPRAMELGPVGRRRKLGGNDVHDAAQRFGAIEHTGWSANDFHALREPRVERRTILVAPRVVLQSAAIGEHEHAWAEQAANHRLAHLLAGRDVPDASELRHRVGQGDAAVQVDLLAGEHTGGEWRGTGRDGRTR